MINVGLYNVYAKGLVLMKLNLKHVFFYFTVAGAILAIGPRVGTIPSMLHLDTFCLPVFSVFTNNEFRNLFKELNLLYFVHHFA